MLAHGVWGVKRGGGRPRRAEDGRLTPRQFTLRTLPGALEERGDPWARMARHRRRLPDEVRVQGG